MGFCTSLFFPSGIETEIFPTSIAELKGVLVQNRVTDLTGMGLHSLKRIRVRAYLLVGRGSRVSSSKNIFAVECHCILMSE